MVRILLTFILGYCPALLLAQSATENNEVFIVTSINKEQAYVQEEVIFSIKLYYTLSFERGAAFSRPEMSEAAVSRLGESLEYTETIDGVTYAVNENRFVIFPQNSGEFTIEPIRFRAYTQTRSSRDNPNLRTTETRDLVELESNSLQLDVLPVPSGFPSPNWLPSSAITISETFGEPLASMKLGDSLVRTIHIKAENLFSSMLLNLDFISESSLRQYATAPEQVDIRENHGTRSEHIQNITLVATRAGQITLPAIEIPWWNTTTDSLEYASLPARTVDILDADGQRLEPEPQVQTPEESPGLLPGINLSLVIFVGMLILVSSLFFAPVLMLLGQKLQRLVTRLSNRDWIQRSPAQKQLLSIREAYAHLKTACEKRQLKTLAEQTLLWGQAYYENKNLYSLDRLKSVFKDDELQGYLTRMQSCLYGDKAADFEYDAFLKRITHLHRLRKQSLKQQIRVELPPLYHN